MEYSLNIDKESAKRRKLYSFLSQPMRSTFGQTDADKDHMGSLHLVQISKVMDTYCAPLRDSNNTGLWPSEFIENDYVNYLERKNKSLSFRVAELEVKFNAIEQYLPTIFRIVQAYSSGASRVEEKKKLLTQTYSLRKSADIQLWSGATDDIDIAKSTLDDLLTTIEE